MASVKAIQESSPSTLDLSCDDCYFSLLVDSDEPIFDDQISDSKYAEELQFQETIMSSLISVAQEPPLVILEVPKMEIVKTGEEGAGEKGESSQMFCEICAERKGCEEMFRVESCGHEFCRDCVSKHVETKIQESVCVVTCPGLNCRGALEFDKCKAIVPDDVLNRWGDVLCESMISASEKFYCPYRDCSAMLVNDGNGDGGGVVIKESECPFCHRLFCAQCYVPWHAGVECEEFQRLNPDERGREDIMVRELAKEKSWKRCPECKYYIEKAEGCLHMTCRCGSQFCYACGAKWSLIHSGCQ